MNLREAEAESIRAFVQSAADDGYLSGKVLDYGAGRMPYREMIEHSQRVTWADTRGEYLAYDRAGFPANLSGEDIGELPYARGITAILCTQVLQYVPDPFELLRQFQLVLTEEWWDNYQRDKIAWLVLTYPTNWPEVEADDLHRFTKAGMERMLKNARFKVEKHEWRHGFRSTTGESFAAGYGCIARA